MTTIEQILAIDDAHKECVTVEQWAGAEVWVYSMTANERADIEKRWSEKKISSDPASFRRDLLTKTLKKQDGTPLGTDEQIGQLMNKNSAAIERLFEVACRLCGFSAKDVEELEGN